MKFMSILLKEGRREDLKQKYSKKFEGGTGLDFILNISDLVDFNHKYTDWLLKNVDPESENFDDDVEIGVNLVKSFDKYQSQLDKKDINQYKSFEELDSALLPIKQKQKEKELEKQVEKIYEDDKFIVIKPQTHQASCKYGANTKWCTTAQSDTHFKQYTSGNQLLFYIIDKKNSKSGNYSKVAVHFATSGKESWWDTQDTAMSEREVNVFKYAFPEIVDAINDYKTKFTTGSMNQEVVKVFNIDGVEVFERKFLLPNVFLIIRMNGFENIEDMPGHAIGEVEIYLKSKGKLPQLIDSYSTMILYSNVKYDERFGQHVFSIDVGFQGNDPSEETDYVDLGLEGLGFKNYVVLKEPERTVHAVRNHIITQVYSKIQNNTDLQNKVTGGAPVFTPTYGYTFGRNKGMISKLIKYLDSEKIGTKLDFLTDIGYLEKIVKDGKTKYRRGNQTFEPRDLRGQHASFFAAAKNAGILGYRKVGRDYFLTKGPNFDAYKEGRLRAL